MILAARDLHAPLTVVVLWNFFRPTRRSGPGLSIGGYHVPLARGHGDASVSRAIGFGISDGPKFKIQEATIIDIQNAFLENKLTSRELVQFYLEQIHKLNRVLRAVIEVNPDALAQADEADRRRHKARKGPSKVLTRGLDGIPILLKDNIATKDKLNTTAGSYALLGSVVPRDAGVVKRLRQAGAIILGKASLSEWANFRSSIDLDGWCARGGQGHNPYNLSQGPSGSSSGSAIAVATNLVAVTLGTETDGSILSPSSTNSVVGIKPTLGLTSRGGVIPITPRQDSVGYNSDNHYSYV